MDTELVFTPDDRHWFEEGTHRRLYKKFGAHPATGAGTRFAVWAPGAEGVAVIGDFNDWDPRTTPLQNVDDSGIWEGASRDAELGALYKYHVVSRFNGYRVDKADPFAFHAEAPPRTASVVCDLDYGWNDSEWMRTRNKCNALGAPIAIYELHLGSWRRNRSSNASNSPHGFGYREMASALAEYVVGMGFTHIELLPIMEHPFTGSWGYQTTGYFAPTSRFGTPQDFMYFVDTMHRHGIGVILDWVPSHFPTDQHGLAFFDGTFLYEHADPRLGFHPDWNSAIFNYSSGPVRSILQSSALFWLDRYHIDGIRVDAVASMLYLDYSRKEGEWIPNHFGGRENLDAIHFLRQLNEGVHRDYPEVLTIAEESTAWPRVSRPGWEGGLGFDMKWDMGWMNDTLDYMSKEPVHRKHHQDRLTFRLIYAFAENFMLSLSHDEVVHGKGSLLSKMPGDDWQKFANLRLLLAYMWAQPGKKLLFMGGEFAQRDEWDHDAVLQWELLQHAPHQGVKRLVQDLNRLYRDEPGLSEHDFDPAGFEWIDCADEESSILSFIRRGNDAEHLIVCVFNFTPVPRSPYRIGVPFGVEWTEVFSSDASEYGGSRQGNLGSVRAEAVPFHGHPFSLELNLPPLGAVFFRSSG